MKDEIIIYQANQASTRIENLIFTIRDQQVMLDFHLSQVYDLETKRLNEQVKRNLKRFPDSFMFQLNQTEWDILRSQFATAKRRTLPFAFTEQGVAMLSSVLNSDYAIQVSKAIDAKTLSTDKGIFFNGQIFDAYVFVSEIIKNTKSEIILIDRTELYHIGASLKDLGKKWFAFSRFDTLAGSLLSMLNK